jgi:hypothetical protein
MWMWLQTRYGLDNWVYWHHSEPQAIAALPLISKLFSSLRQKLSPFPAFYVATSHSLATASNCSDSSASRAQALLSQTPVHISCQFSQSQLTTINYGTFNLISCCNCDLFSVILSAGLEPSLYSPGAGPTENTPLNYTYIVGRWLVAEPYLTNFCIATALQITFQFFYCWVRVCCGNYLATAVSLAPQFLLWENMQQHSSKRSNRRSIANSMKIIIMAISYHTRPTREHCDDENNRSRYFDTFTSLQQPMNTKTVLWCTISLSLCLNVSDPC